MSTKLKAAVLTAVFALTVGAAPAAAQDPVSFELWTKEGEADGSLQWVQKLAADYTAANPNVSIEVVRKEVGGTESLRQDFVTQSFAGNPPALLWTVADHLGPFTAAAEPLVLALDGLVDESLYVESGLDAMRTPDGTLYGLPINVGNQLMLYYNKDLMAECPADSDALVQAAIAATDAEAGTFGMVYRQDESFWLVPFLGGYGGEVFAEDGITPTLDTEAMVNALTFMNDLEFVHGVMPVEADYQIADDLFKQGKAAMTINGDWTLGTYVDLFGDKLGLCPLPPMTGGEDPKPYTAGNFFMVSSTVAEDQALQDAVIDFITWATNTDTQLVQLETLKRLPSNIEALADPSVAEDPFLAASAAAVQLGIPQPTNLEMRCVFDAMNVGVRANAASGDADQAQLAADMQAAAATGVAPGGECGPA
jgi:arabinogalactan oligomer/maltooligosaccharide transport system substrate-binding protein